MSLYFDKQDPKISDIFNEAISKEKRRKIHEDYGINPNEKNPHVIWKVPMENSTEPVNDSVNHPKHYADQGVFIEPIDLCRHLPFNLGNACKYLIRAGHKNNEVEDVRKAVWYLTDYYQNFKETIKNLAVSPEENDLCEDARVAKTYVGTFELDTSTRDKFFMSLIWFAARNRYISMLFHSDMTSYWGISLQSLQQTIKQIKNDYKLSD